MNKHEFWIDKWLDSKNSWIDENSINSKKSKSTYIFLTVVAVALSVDVLLKFKVPILTKEDKEEAMRYYKDLRWENIIIGVAWETFWISDESDKTDKNLDVWEIFDEIDLSQAKEAKWSLFEGKEVKVLYFVSQWWSNTWKWVIVDTLYNHREMSGSKNLVINGVSYVVLKMSSDDYNNSVFDNWKKVKVTWANL